jgi:hypothetical protein
MQGDFLPVVADGLALNAHDLKTVIQHLSLIVGGFQILAIESSGN